jgi:uncharacterized membrane protein YidH (DUF202 family)
MSSFAPRRSPAHPRFVFAALLALLGLLLACLGTRDWVEKERPWTQATLAQAKEVRVENADGTSLTVERPQIVHDEHGDFLTGRVPSLGQEEVRIDLATIRGLELREVNPATTVSSIAWGIVIVAAAVLFVLYG